MTGLKIYTGKKELLANIQCKSNNKFSVTRTELCSDLFYNIAVPREPEISYKDILEWLEERITPRTRYNIDELLEEWGLAEYDVEEIVKRTGASNIADDIQVEIY